MSPSPVRNPGSIAASLGQLWEETAEKAHIEGASGTRHEQASATKWKTLYHPLAHARSGCLLLMGKQRLETDVVSLESTQDCAPQHSIFSFLAELCSHSGPLRSSTVGINSTQCEAEAEQSLASQ